MPQEVEYHQANWPAEIYGYCGVQREMQDYANKGWRIVSVNWSAKYEDLITSALFERKVHAVEK